MLTSTFTAGLFAAGLIFQMLGMKDFEATGSTGTQKLLLWHGDSLHQLRIQYKVLTSWFLSMVFHYQQNERQYHFCFIFLRQSLPVQYPQPIGMMRPAMQSKVKKQNKKRCTRKTLYIIAMAIQFNSEPNGQHSTEDQCSLSERGGKD